MDRKDDAAKKPRVVRLRKGETIEVMAGGGTKVLLRIDRLASGAVHVRDGATRKQIRAWAPKDVRGAS